MARSIFNLIQSDAVGGGMENIFLEYSKIIQKHAWEVNGELVCIVSENFCHLEALKAANIKVEILNIKGHFDVLAAIKFFALIRKYSPELIVAHNGRGFATINLCKKIFRIKDITTIAVSHGGSIKRILGFNYIIAVAKHIEEKIKNAGFKGESLTIYNGYKTSNFTKGKIQKDAFIFGTLSRLSKEKNVAAAIKSFKKFLDETTSNSLLIIAGEGEEKTSLKELVKNLDLTQKVKFIGWIKNQEEFFNVLDVFLQPALEEPFGITILESFNYETPVIACNSFGPKEIIIDNYSGYLFEKDDENSLFAAMKKAHLNIDNFPQIIQNAKEELEKKFSYEIMEDKLITTIKTAF